MGRYLAIRLVQLVAITFVVSVLVFLLLRLLPAGPVAAILGPTPSLAAKAELTRELGLDHSLPQQYWTWLDHALHGDLGHSYSSGVSTTSVIKNAYTVDLELIVYSQLIAFVVAVPAALLAARRPGGIFDGIVSTMSFGMLALPSFVIGPILVLLLAVKVHAFPDIGYVSITSDLGTNLRDMTLPAVTVAFGSLPVYFRLLRGDLVTTLQEDFVALARAKGLGTTYILARHALRPSSFSMLGAAGITIGSLITGAVVVEQIFQLPGMGYQLIYYIGSRDYLVVQGLALVIAVFYVVVNFAVGFLYAAVDPRVRHT